MSSSTANLFDFAVCTIFAREVLEASVIIINYRTLINRKETWQDGMSKNDALRAINVATIMASLVAIAVITAVALPLGILSRSFDKRVSLIIEGVSKIVAAVCILQLSLKMPKWLGVYVSKKTVSHMDIGSDLTLRSIRFNVAWNIWREVAECGVFLLPFFLTGEGLKAIPLSAIVGTVIGLLCGLGIHYANKTLKRKTRLAIFTSTLLLFLSAGLFSGGCGNIEKATTSTKQVWSIEGEFWSTDRLPMTIIKPFGYTDTRSILQIVCFWTWLVLGIVLHCFKYKQTKYLRLEQALADYEERTSQQLTESIQEDDEINTPDGENDAEAQAKEHDVRIEEPLSTQGSNLTCSDEQEGVEIRVVAER
jgi:high-affinity iron transporter